MAVSAPPGSTTPTPPAYTPPALSPRELSRWAWRQLTSMRTALVLLFLLALAAVPGSVIPQTRVSPLAVATLRDNNPALAGIYDRLGLFNVYSSPWFSAIYLLLMVSLVGCIVPRSKVYWRALRARPPHAPRNLDRLPEHRHGHTDADPADVADTAVALLRGQRFRVDRYVDERGRHVVAAERGFLREAGNLVFHLSLLVVLVGVAVGALFGYTGGVIVVAGQGFANTLTQYDEFQPGVRFDPATLDPFSLRVQDFSVRYQPSGPQRGSPLSFNADVTYTTEPGAPERRYDLRVNHPLQIDGTSVFLIGHGYAPVVSVRDGRGRVVFSGPVTFLPQDSSFTSYGVVKAPDAAPSQLAFEGYFLPTLVFDRQAGPISVFPDAVNPALVLLAYRGDLGLDSGQPQSVYELDRDELVRFRQPDGEPFRMLLSPGQSKTLPNGAGSITFRGLDPWVKLQVSRSPAKIVPLSGVLLAIVGLLASLFIRPRRTWVRAGADGGRTVIEVAGLDRAAGGDLARDMDALLAGVTAGPDARSTKEEQR